MTNRKRNLPRGDKIFYLIGQLAALAVLSYVLISAGLPKSSPIETKRLPAIKTAAPTASTDRARPLPKLPTIPAEEAPDQVLNFTDLKLSAASAIVYDLNTGQTLYSLYPTQKHPIASITKIMTAYDASLLAPADSEIEIKPADAAVENSAGLIAGERWRLSDLIAFTLISSSNGGAAAIARTAAELSGVDFIESMNQTAREIGMNNTLFRNETGLDLHNGQLSGSYSTAADLVLLLGHIIRTNPQLLSVTARPEMVLTSDSRRHEAVNTNLLVAKVPNVLASKTGTTDLAGGNLAMVFQAAPDHTVAIIVLGSTPSGRFNDADKLVKASIAFFK
jgi:D-alanyl-D-alanine carboxypeptidase